MTMINKECNKGQDEGQMHSKVSFLNPEIDDWGAYCFCPVHHCCSAILWETLIFI